MNRAGHPKRENRMRERIGIRTKNRNKKEWKREVEERKERRSKKRQGKRDKNLSCNKKTWLLNFQKKRFLNLAVFFL